MLHQRQKRVRSNRDLDLDILRLIPKARNMSHLMGIANTHWNRLKRTLKMLIDKGLITDTYEYTEKGRELVYIWRELARLYPREREYS